MHRLLLILCYNWKAEAIVLKQKTIKMIDQGNRMLGLDRVPRDVSGSLIDPTSAGIMTLFKVVSYSVIH